MLFALRVLIRGAVADISELNLAKGTTIVFPDGQDKILSFEITIRPDEGLYKYVFAMQLHSAC